MTPPENHNSINMHMELRERLVAIETKLDQYNETRQTAFTALAVAQRNQSDIAEIKTFIRETRMCAEAAKNNSDRAREDIDEDREARKWERRTTFGLALGFVFSVALKFLPGI